MIIDFRESKQTEYIADICIVGTGAAGLAIAEEFFDSGLKVILLESGENELNSNQQELINATIIGHHYRGTADGRALVFGGATTKWGGQGLPLSKIDFESRSWVPNSGWPIHYNDFAKYLNKADQFLRNNDFEYSKNIFELSSQKPFELVKNLNFHYSKWCSQPNLREIFRNQLQKSTNVTVVLNAHLTDIELDSSLQNASKLHIKADTQKAGTVKSKMYILACGGLENARILMASNKQIVEGIGNKNDIVGRFLQDHPTIEVATIKPKNQKQFQAYFNYFYQNKTRIMPRFVATEAWQSQNKVLGASAYFNFSTPDNGTFEAAKNIYRNFVRKNFKAINIADIIKIIKDIPTLATILYNFYFNKKVYTPNAQIRLQVMLEQDPNTNSRVYLSPDLDKMGMPKLVVDWQLSEQVKRTFFEFIKLQKAQFEALDMGEIFFDKWIEETPNDCLEMLSDALHPIGTTRMGVDDKVGVVDKNLKVFGMSNLYIAGSSVFPTSGSSNPTLSLISLAKRLSEHLKMLLEQ